ncbi:MAG: chloride channel protein [Parvularculaceae bacterium]|nr:MAG: chloride channel protein [Parvularculaceae bacterium]
MHRTVTRTLIGIRRMRRRLKALRTAAVWVFAVLIGAASAYGIIGFLFTINFISALAFGETEKMIVSGASRLGPVRAFMAPVFGGFVIAGLLYLADKAGWLPGGRGQGVADVIEARAVKSGKISARAGVASAALAAVSVGAGGSAGREGPAVHLGAAIASFLDDRFGFSAKDRRILLGCGAAGAVAASFNAPIAGVLFALEVVMGAYGLSIFGPIAAASVTAAIVIRTHLGDFPAVSAPEYGMVGNVDVALAALLGLLCGLFATALLLASERLTLRVRQFADDKKLSYIFLPPIGGVIVGAIGAFYPEVFGVGYEAVQNVFSGEYELHLLFIILLLKIIATAVTLSCRFGGGVFSPGLVIGAFGGGAFGVLVNSFSPIETAGPAFFAMVGMGAASGAIIGAPISTTMIVFEMTGDYALTISLIVAVALATLVTQAIAGNSFFHWQLSRRGYDMSDGPQGVILKTMRVRDVMERMPPCAPLSETASRLDTQASLGEALAKLEREDEVGLPVVSSRAPDDVIGYLSRVRALNAYNKALIDSHIDHHR